MASNIFSLSFLLALVLPSFLLLSTAQKEERRRRRQTDNTFTPMTWESAQEQCRRQGGFLAGWEESEGSRGEWDLIPTTYPLVWTALTPHQGRYQWLSQCPDGRKQATWTEAAPKLWDRDCVAFNLSSNQFSLHPCTEPLPFVCFQSQHQAEDLSDVELVVTGSEEPDPYDWYNITQQEFSALTLNCTAYSRRTGKPLDVQPTVFWSKDNVYTGHCKREIKPATLQLEGTQDLSQPEGDNFSRQQGVYQCGAWRFGSTQLLHSKKVLVTLQDRVVVILEAHLNATLKVGDVRGRLRVAFSRWFSGRGDYVLDPVAVIRNEEESEDPVVKYTFHLHMLRTSLRDGNVKTLEYQRKLYQSDYEANGFLPTSTVMLPTLCFSETKSFGSGQNIEWPFTSAGNVHPINHRCRVEGKKLKSGRCVWDFTRGAYFTFDSSGCEWTDLCPKGYTMLSDWLCMDVSTPGPWGTGFKAVYKTGQEMSILDHSMFLSTVYQRSGVFKHIHILVRNKTRSSMIWLPVKRIRKFGPLNYLDPITKNLTSNPIDVLNKLEITWADDGSDENSDCLALDLASHQLLTKHCSSWYPFVSIIKADFLKQSSSDFPNSLISSNPLCDSGWNSTQLTQKLFCFKLFNPPTKLTWPEAKTFCEKQNASLPSPNVDFLDWVYRKYILSNGVPQVWMNAWNRGSWIQFSGSRDHLNWLPTEDYEKKFGSLRPDGWTLEDKNATLAHVLCQTTVRHIHNLHLELVKSTVESSHRICIKVKLNELLDGGLRLFCYVNGIYTPPLKQDGQTCPYELTIGNQGYYECYGWSQKPTTLVHSNTILHEELGTFTFIVSMLRQQNYTAHDYDIPLHTCSDDVVDYLTNNSQVNNFDITAENVFYKPSQNRKLLENFHIKFKPNWTDSRYTEGEMLNTLRHLLPAGATVSNCSLHRIRRTTGCQKDAAWNLTQPETKEKGAVMPEELCVTSDGKCLGDFILGYVWSGTKMCTKQITTVTHQLWQMKNNPEKYPLKSLSALTSNSLSLSPMDVHLAALIMESFTHLNTSLHLDHMADILNNIMGARAQVLQDAQMKVNTTQILLDSFEALIFKIELPSGQERRMTVSREYISVLRVALEANSTVIGYQSNRGTTSQRHGLLNQGESLEGLNDVEVAIVFPDSLIYRLTSKSVQEGNKEPTLELTFAVYRNTNLFQDASIAKEYIVNTPILQAAFKNHVVQNLDTPVKIIFKPTKKGDGGKCVFWNFGKNEGRGGWSVDGCWKTKKEGTKDYVVCYCSHLTSFAHLINYSEDPGIKDIHVHILDTLTIIGCCISIISLILIFFTFILFKEWRQVLSHKIHLHLAVAIFLTVVTFVIGINQVWNVILCRTVAIALHYFILSSFGWMLVEGVCLYLKIVRLKAESHLTFFFRMSLVCAWVIPLLPVVALCTYDLSFYDNRQDICWMSSWAFKVAFLPPLVITLAVNLILFSLSFYAATCGRTLLSSSASQRSRFINQVSLSVCGFFLLGFTWFFGMLAVGEVRLVFSYLFCIFNILQGIFLFLLVRKHWVKVFSALSHRTVFSFFNSRGTRDPQGDRVTYDDKSGQVIVNSLESHRDSRKERARLVPSSRDLLCSS